MAKFLEVLTDGLTVSGRVQPAGARVQVSEDFPLLSKKDQSKRWGAPRYREITQADFTGSGGAVTGEESVAEPAEVEEVVEVEEAEVTTEDKFAFLAGANVEDTLAAAAEFSDEDLAEFIAFEQAGKNRAGVLGPLGVSSE